MVTHSINMERSHASLDIGERGLICFYMFYLLIGHLFAILFLLRKIPGK